MNHVADDVTYCHDLHYAAATLGLVDGGHEKKKKEGKRKRADTLEKRNPSGRVRAGWKVREQGHARHVEPHMARGFPLLKARLT